MYRVTRNPKSKPKSASKKNKKRNSKSAKRPSPRIRPRAKKLKLAVIGVGNPLMCDDGAGIEVLDALRKMPLPAGTEIMDCGTGGMALLHTLADLDAVVIADAVDFDGSPGEVKTFSPEDVVSVKELKRLTLHEGDVFEILVLARKLGQCPERIIICAIQPKRIEPRQGMTRQVRESIPEMASHVRRALKRILSR